MNNSPKIHFTYKQDMDVTSLCQGDVLFATDEIKKIMEDVHPYFLKEQYKYFMVLTQSCDLVKRGNKSCKAPYITLAAVRSLDDFFEKQIIQKYATKIHGLVFLDERKKTTAVQLIDRVFNNTEQGYFFLYKEEMLDFPETMVAYLRVAISLKSQEHYDECLRAKRLELSDEFKAKLGWLVGDVYARVGTTDWDSIKTKKEKQKMFEDELQSRCIISTTAKLNALKEEIAERPESFNDKTAVDDFLNNIKIETTYDKTITVIEECINEYNSNYNDVEVEKFMNIIRNKSVLKAILGNN